MLTTFNYKISKVFSVFVIKLRFRIFQNSNTSCVDTVVELLKNKFDIYILDLLDELHDEAGKNKLIINERLRYHSLNEIYLQVNKNIDIDNMKISFFEQNSTVKFCLLNFNPYIEFTLIHKRNDSLKTDIKDFLNIDIKQFNEKLANRIYIIVLHQIGLIDSYQQLGIPSELFVSLNSLKSIEMFASPVNNNLLNYCSIFCPIDFIFGSLDVVANLEIFNRLTQPVDMVFCNPPYIEVILNALSSYISHQIKHFTYIPHFILSYPSWLDNKAICDLLSYMTGSDKIHYSANTFHKLKHYYIDHLKNQRIVSTWDSLVIVISMDKKKAGEISRAVNFRFETMPKPILEKWQRESHYYIEILLLEQ
jgi:hypothetical protein